MAAATETAPILVEKSFKEENDKIKMRYLNHGCLWVASNLWKKYKEWYKRTHGVDFPEQAGNDDRGEESEDEEDPEWVKQFLNPSSYISPLDDDQEDAALDGFDEQRTFAIDIPQQEDGSAFRTRGMRSMVSMMIGMIQVNEETASGTRGGGAKATSDFVRNFEASMLSKTEDSKRKKLFVLKIKLLNVKADIFRIVQVGNFLFYTFTG